MSDTQPCPFIGPTNLVPTALKKLRPDGYAMLMSPNKGEITVHGCHCRGDMVVRMCKVLAVPWSSHVCFRADNW